MTESSNYIRFTWNGKRYRWKKTRLFALSVILMLIITTIAIIHINNVCKRNIPITKEEAIHNAELQQKELQKTIDDVNAAIEKDHKRTENIADDKLDHMSKESKIETNEMPIYSSSSVKRYMDRKTVTDTSTKNYKICRNASVNDDGTLSYDGRTVIAIGQKYGKPGTKLDITLQNDEGNTHTVKTIVGDSKQYQHTQNNAGWVAADGSLLEIVVDTNTINDLSRKMGDMNYTPALNGTIVKIIKVD
jgi:hypothetical protein